MTAYDFADRPASLRAQRAGRIGNRLAETRSGNHLHLQARSSSYSRPSWPVPYLESSLPVRLSLIISRSSFLKSASSSSRLWGSAGGGGGAS